MLFSVHGEEVLVVGSQVLGAGAAPYSGTGPGRSLGFRLRNHGPQSRRGPDVLAASDESTGVAGLLAAAIYGSDKVRLSGTSMAAAVMTRQIIESGYVDQRRVRRLNPSYPRRSSAGDAAHPDDDLASGF